MVSSDPGSPLRRIVAHWGSYRQCAEALGLTVPAVYHWCDTGWIGSRNLVRVILAARELDPPVKLTPNDFFPEEYL